MIDTLNIQNTQTKPAEEMTLAELQELSANDFQESKRLFDLSKTLNELATLYWDRALICQTIIDKKESGE